MSEDKTLVEQMRGDLPDKKVESHWITDYTAVEMQNHEAADLIEAQAAEITRLTHVNQELQSENARMRAALKPFAELGFPYACEALGGNDE